MLSSHLQVALERELVGQSRAVRTLVRALTVVRAGLSRPGAPAGVYMFVGPTGTGKTHFAKSLARLLHGDLRQLAIADCTQRGGGEDWPVLLARQSQAWQQGGQTSRRDHSSVHSILLIEHLECAEAELVRGLVSALETGRVTLPEGKSVSLEGCLILLTGNVCEREIYGEDRQVGFSSSGADLEESEKARIFQICSAETDRRWGLMARLDDLVVFHRLRECHVGFILERLLDEMNGQLAGRHVRCKLDPQATSFLVSKADPFLQHGAWFLVKLFRRFVTFPIADLLASNTLPVGGEIEVKYEGGERLSFESRASDRSPAPSPDGHRVVPVSWEVPAAVS